MLSITLPYKISYMKQNMGTLDKGIRVAVAVIIAILYFTHVISGTLAIILLVFAVIFLITSLFGFCPLYLPFGISTKNDN